MPRTAEDFKKKEFVYSKINKLPYSIGGLVKLTRLNLSECAKIKELLDSVGKLQSLVELNLSFTSIGHLPDSISNLKQLKVLRMRNIRGITKLPSAIGLLEKLEELDVSACHNLTGEIPEEIGRLSFLKILDLSDTSISRLPDSIGNLKQLKVLRMSRISGITRLPSTTRPVEKPSELDASSCHDLISEAPEKIERRSRLRTLDLSWTKISGLPTTVSRLSNLQTLKLELCPELKQVYEQEANSARPASIGALSQQETLDTALPTSIGTLSQMETLTLSSENVQFFPQLPSSLRELQLKNLATPRSPDFSNLRNLSTLTLYGCSMPEFSGIINAELELVRMDFCKFRKLDLLFQLEMKRLGSLTMCQCEFLPEALDLSRMKNLQYVFLSDCQLLIEICGLEELVSLSSLQVERCGSLERMSDLSKLKKLWSLRVENCPKLRSAEGLNHLESLERLMITNAGEFGGDTSNLNVKYTCIR
ncbi:uncharacterized protein J3R85_014732 [Psidium guajava]|nr:uncharacterized protein J3R85_014732 [Psidium guajava]